MPTIKKKVLKKAQAKEPMAKEPMAHAKDPVAKDPEEYAKQLSEQERIVLEIAKEHLESSYDMARSIGYCEWHKQRACNE